jgi:hypothetical protein
MIIINKQKVVLLITSLLTFYLTETQVGILWGQVWSIVILFTLNKIPEEQRPIYLHLNHTCPFRLFRTICLSVNLSLKF